MSAFPQATPDEWRRPRAVNAAADHLIAHFKAAYPQAVDAIALGCPVDEVLEQVAGLTVVVDHSVRGSDCPIDGTYDADTATVYYRPTANKRDQFTLLHELGHHLLAADHDWCFTVQPDLGKDGRRIEELMASTFAARLLIPEVSAQAAFAKGVTAEGVRWLNEKHTNASATACLVRGVTWPGERLGLLTDLAGYVYFCQSSGEPYAPAFKTKQPGIADLIERARETPEHAAKREGGHGIVYKTGNANTNVILNVAIDDQLAFTIATPTGLLHG